MLGGALRVGEAAPPSPVLRSSTRRSRAVPGALHDIPTAEALQAIVDLDLEMLTNIEPPRGYGRD